VSCLLCPGAAPRHGNVGAAGAAAGHGAAHAGRRSAVAGNGRRSRSARRVHGSVLTPQDCRSSWHPATTDSHAPKLTDDNTALVLASHVLLAHMHGFFALRALHRVSKPQRRATCRDWEVTLTSNDVGSGLRRRQRRRAGGRGAGAAAGAIDGDAADHPEGRPHAQRHAADAGAAGQHHRPAQAAPRAGVRLLSDAEWVSRTRWNAVHF